jgi:CubicO group peptidase (beta-lactamase class C family)
LISRTAPTENGNGYEKKMASKKYQSKVDSFMWRDYVIRGETHDANSFYLGGTAGNSGLFSTAEDIYKIALEIYPSTTSILKPQSAQFFWKNFTPGKFSHRTCGFKLNSSLLTSGGKALSRKAIGHNGFTGTSIWLQPESQVTYILLSNRIHPQVKNLNFNRIRRKIHTYIKSDLDL